MDHTGNVAIADQADRGADRPDFLDQPAMARAIENAGGDLGDVDALGLGERGQILLRAFRQRDDAGRIARPDGDLFHIDVRHLQEAAFRRHGEHRDGVRQVLGADRLAFERVERDVDRRPLARADAFADEQGRRLAFLALADDDGAVDRQSVEFAAHGVDGSLIGGLFVAAPAQPGCRDRRMFSHARQFEREGAIQRPRFLAHRLSPPCEHKRSPSCAM